MSPIQLQRGLSKHPKDKGKKYTNSSNEKISILTSILGGPDAHKWNSSYNWKSSRIRSKEAQVINQLSKARSDHKNFG